VVLRIATTSTVNLAEVHSKLVNRGLPPNDALEMAEAAIPEVPEQEWDRLPADLAINVDHYLYGSRKKTE
jgi:PIN domain nuclease of toxin-antitoxin system